MINIQAQGLGNLEKKLGARASARMRQKLDNTTEKAVREMAKESAKMAPVLDNVLRPSIVASVKKEGDMAWSYGSSLPYARRQEYENASSKGFFRRSLWGGRTKYRDAIKSDLRHIGK